MYINDRRLRLILFAPLFFKDVITQGSVQEDSPDLTIEAKEIVKNQVDTINNSINFADKFFIDTRQKYDVDKKRFFKQVINVNKVIRKCYNLYYNKQTKECQTTKVVTAVIFAFYNFFYEICEHDGFNFYVDDNNEYIITDKQYEFLKPYANIIKTNFIEPLAILGNNTLEYNTAQALNKGKKFNEEKFYKQCESNVENIINLLKNI